MDTTPVYDLSYEYDQLGNRTKTTDNVTGWYILYAYDTVAECRSEQYPTNNNRLLWYAIFDQPGGEVCPEGGIAHGGPPIPGPIYEPSEPPPVDAVRWVMYTYWDNGDVANITVRDREEPLVRKDLSLCYNGNATLWLAFWDEWELEWSPGLERYVYKSGSYEQTAAREFRFDTARARYLARDVDVINLQPTADPDDMNLWTDYLGEVPLLDYQLDYVDEWHSTVTERRTYLAGFGPQAYQDLPGGETFYLHGDLIGSSVLTTEEAGTAGDTFAYTAFGEPIGPGGVGVPPANGPRYRYAGAWGYESDLLELQGPDQTLPPIGLLHVGWRWYQPSIGRFVERDPIGLAGGKNLYAYVRNDPVRCADPEGLWLESNLPLHMQPDIQPFLRDYPPSHPEEPWWPKVSPYLHDYGQNAVNSGNTVMAGGILLGCVNPPVGAAAAIAGAVTYVSGVLVESVAEVGDIINEALNGP